MVRVDVDVEQHTFCLETLANQLRLDIIRLLDEHGELNVTRLAKETGGERSRVSHALQILRQCKLVKATKKGREMTYSLDPETPLFKHGRGNLFTMIEAHARKHCPSCAKYQARLRGEK